MSETRPRRRDSVSAVLLAVLLVLSAVAGVAGIGAAHGETDHVSREGDDIVVRLGDQHDVEQAKQITVAVEEGKTVTSPKQENATDTFRIPVSDLSAPDRNLEDTNVTVKANDTTLFTEREDLRVLTFGGEASLADDGTLHVPLTEALGYTDGKSVPVTLDGKSANGTVEYGENGASLVVSFSPDEIGLPLPKDAAVRVSGQGTTNVPLRKIVDRATAVTGVNSETVVITNPLLTANANYELAIQTKGPSGRFAGTVETNETGALTVSDPALAGAEKLTASVYRDGGLLFEGETTQSTTEEPIRANVTEDGTGVNLSEPLPTENVTDQKATVWITNGSQYVQATNVPVTENGSHLDLLSAGYRLVNNGDYRLVVTSPEFARIDVSGNESVTNAILQSSGRNGDSGGDSDSSDSNGPLGYGLSNIQFLGGGLVVVGLIVGVVVVASTLGGGRKSASTEKATATSRANENTLTVIVNDAATNTRLDDATVTANEIGSTRSGPSTQVTDGKGTLTVGRGRWKVTAESNGVTDQQRVKIVGNATVTFDLGPRRAKVTVDDDDGEPLSNVRVTCTPDDGPKSIEQTDAQGRVEIDVPLGANEVELSADHEKYEGDETTVTFDGEMTASASLTLRRLTGDLRVTSTVDGTPVPGVRVEVTPREESVRQLGEAERAVTTDETGTAAFEGLLVGRYEIDMKVPSSGDVVRTTSKRVRIRDGTVTRESLDATFEYDLDRSDRDRISDIRRDVESLGSASGRDVAIPRYYGTVVTDLLDAVERIPDQGHQFATADVDPDEVVTALLDAAEETVRLVSNAMTTKRNTDLFGACVDMPDQRVEWTGQFDSDILFELLGEDRKTQRQTVLQQLRKVDDRIDAERSALAVVEPAREPWERTQEFVNSERGEDLVRGAAVAFVAEGLLDAVDELFDHEELRERLERTVF